MSSFLKRSHLWYDLMKRGGYGMTHLFEFDSLIHDSDVGKGGAYIIFPHNIRDVFGKGRVKVRVTFDGIPYNGSIVNMGVKNEDGTVCYIIGMRKDIREQLNKKSGDVVHVTVRERGE